MTDTEKIKKKAKKKDMLSKKILKYLGKNPKAGDTLEGISTWWLEQQRIEEVVDEVAEALEYLESKGFIQGFKSNAGTTIYRIKSKEKD